MVSAEIYRALAKSLAGFIPSERLITDPLRLLTWGTDASFYRLVPKIAVVVESEDEVRSLLRVCAQAAAPITFRAAGTSLSGQAITDSVLMLLGDGWRGCTIGTDASTITLQPGVLGATANARLARHGRKIGPDPASIDAAMIGGIAANNASGMCCGTAQNSYHTLVGMRVVLADGTVLDTGDPASRAAFVEQKPQLVRELDALARSARGDPTLAARIRHKFRMKNTTGYSLNALVDFEDPIDVLSHLMIGSEGTLGFISEITYRTVPEYANKASALILFDTLESACLAVTRLTSAPVAAVELADRAALRSVEGKPGLPESLHGLGRDAAALLVETRAANSAALAVQVLEIQKTLEGIHTTEPVRFSTDAQECARFWNVRKGMFPSVGAMRKLGTTVIIEDVAFPVQRLAEATLDLQRLLSAHGYVDAIIFGHALEGNLHFVFTQDFHDTREVERYRGFRELTRAGDPRGDDRDDIGLAAAKGQDLWSAAGDHQRRVRLLDHLGAAFGLRHRVVRAGEVHLIFGEQSLHERDRLGQPRDAHAAAVERDAGALVVAIEPARANAELEPPAREHVEHRDLAREDDRVAEVVVDDQRAEAQLRGDRHERRQRGQRGPRTADHVIGHRERVIAERLDPLGAREPLPGRRSAARLCREAHRLHDR